MNAPLDTTERHHFVPRFYLKEWHEPGTSGFWLYFRDKQGQLRLRQRSASSVAFVENLYSIKPDGLNFRHTVSHELEKGFFTPIDTAAALVHRKLLTAGANSLVPEERWAWAVFVNSLIERSPTRLAELEANAANLPDESLAAFKEKWPNALARPSLKAIMDRMDKPALVANTVRSAVIRYIMEPKFLQYVVEMDWATVDLPAGDDHYLTGDTPVVINGGNGAAQTPIHIMAMAISPKRLLFMHKKAPEFDERLLVIMAHSFSITIVKQTIQYLVSSRTLQDSRFIMYTKIVDQLGRANAGVPAPSSSSDPGSNGSA